MHDNIPKVATQTPDLGIERQAQLRELFPEAWSEGALDFSKLRTLLGDLSDESAERYRFGWAGKRESLQLLQTPSHAALRPAPDESIDFDATQNLFIEGDNLEVLKLLYKPLFNRVKMIYIDPPYNTGNDFIYPDNFTDPLKNYLIQTEQKDANGDLQTSAPDVAGRVHSRWLSMLYPRLTLARSLLRDDGVIFVSIDDNEVHHLRLLMNEVFGEENFVAELVWKKKYTGGKHAKHFVDLHEYVLVFAKALNCLDEILIERPEEEKEKFDLEDEFLETRGKYYTRPLKSNLAFRPTLIYPIDLPDGTTIETQWLVARDTFDRLLIEKRVEIRQKLDGNYQVYRKYYEKDGDGKIKVPSLIDVASNNDAKVELKTLFQIEEGRDNLFDTAKPTNLLIHLFKPMLEKDSIVLDFFAGSCSTAEAILKMNRQDGGSRRFIVVQLPHLTDEDSAAYKAGYLNIADIGKERIRRVIGRMKEQPLLDTRETPEDLGFKVWKLGESHFRQFQPTEQGDVEAYIEQLELMNDALLPGFEPRAVLYEVALREGYGLNCSLEPVADLQGVSVWRVSDADRGQHFFATLDASLELESLRPLKLSPDDWFICRGIALDDDTAANLALQCRLKMI